MIKDQKREGWIGASDSSYVTGNWKTESFRKWYKSKLGLTLYERKFNNKYTLAGTYYEHAILMAIDPRMMMDAQITKPELGLRVNYDGILGDTIYEVKTHQGSKEFKVTKAYWRQAQVEMFAADTTKLYVVSYPLQDKNYDNYFIPINKGSLRFTMVDYDQEWIYGEYLPKLKYMTECIKQGKYPQGAEFEVQNIQSVKGMRHIDEGKKICLRTG